MIISNDILRYINMQIMRQRGSKSHKIWAHNTAKNCRLQTGSGLDLKGLLSFVKAFTDQMFWCKGIDLILNGSMSSMNICCMMGL